MSGNEYMVTQKEAADFLNVSTKSISRYRKRGLPYKLILNAVTGKQEVRFRYADLERWDEGRQLLATYGRDGEESTAGEPKTDSRRAASAPETGGFLDDLLLAYKEQIELLRDQLEDMREQLARRDRQIDDLMRLMVGLQLEYKPLAADPKTAEITAVSDPFRGMAALEGDPAADLYTSIDLPDPFPYAAADETGRTSAVIEPSSGPGLNKKVFSPEQLSVSILRLRRKGKSFEDIVRGLNQIGAATLSGQPRWTVPEVQTLLPSLVGGTPDPNGADHF